MLACPKRSPSFQILHSHISQARMRWQVPSSPSCPARLFWCQRLAERKATGQKATLYAARLGSCRFLICLPSRLAAAAEFYPPQEGLLSLNAWLPVPVNWATAAARSVQLLIATSASLALLITIAPGYFVVPPVDHVSCRQLGFDAFKEKLPVTDGA